MIENKEDLKRYLNQDRIMLGRKGKHPRIFGDEIWKFQISLRKHEYYKNTRRSWILEKFWEWRHHRLGVLLGFTIPCNVFGAGLNIHHFGGGVVVNAHARVGDNCNIQQGVNIGQNLGKEDVPIIGNNVYIGPGAKIFGKIMIADNCAIGANAVVTHSCMEQSKNLVGIPARIAGNRRI